jgi:hypothetical protein
MKKISAPLGKCVSCEVKADCTHCTLLDGAVKCTKCDAALYLKDPVSGSTTAYDNCHACGASIATHWQSGAADGTGICEPCDKDMTHCLTCTDIGDECLTCAATYWPFDAEEICENNTCDECTCGKFVDTDEDPGRIIKLIRSAI